MLVDGLQEQGREVRVIARNQRYVDPDVPFFACEIDAELLIDGKHVNCEIKTTHPFAAKQWGEMETDEMPVYYATQALWGIDITQRVARQRPGSLREDRCIVGCLVGADSMTPYWVERDDLSVGEMRGKAMQFWRHVQDLTAPDPQNFSDLRHLFRRDNGLAIEATKEIAELLEQYANVKASLKSFAFEEERLKFEIENFIRPHARLTYHGRDIATLKSQEQNRFDEKTFAETYPDLAAQFRRTIDFRVLRLKKGF